MSEDTRYDAERIRRLLAMDGLAMVSSLIADGVPHSPFTAGLSMTVTDVRRGRVEMTLVAQERHTTHSGIVHGGVLATLCDSACGYAVQSLLPAGQYALGADLHLRFLRPARTGPEPLRCIATARQPVGSSILAEAELLGPQGALLAHATATILPRHPGTNPA
ncbi:MULTISPECIES: PaaI family thioesterase [Streptomyces]|uniref:PaaI family thioesterase n=1 Tax=Streptomyces TaxID=1883 RepID=UPI001E29A187|nr:MULTISPECIES: PaaI family thioesterase [Streptomyces]UFQ13565.1 PaaI family thioesterase [Streptomyces huasconensis]WCL83162.1 PaaI family thioesterase [Streptomyces sp. JCM 35825]